MPSKRTRAELEVRIAELEVRIAELEARVAAQDALIARLIATPPVPVAIPMPCPGPHYPPQVPRIVPYIGPNSWGPFLPPSPEIICGGSTIGIPPVVTTTNVPVAAGTSSGAGVPSAAACILATSPSLAVTNPASGSSLVAYGGVQ